MSDEGRLLDFLNRLAAYTSELDMAGAVPFITALMDVGDSLPLRGTGMYDVWPGHDGLLHHPQHHDP